MRRFGSWTEALRAAGFEPNQTKNIPRARLLAEIRRLAEDLDRSVSIKDMREHGKYTGPTYQRRFGSWNDAILAAGVMPNTGYSGPMNGTSIEPGNVLAELG